jgi:hypothetical protein
MEPFRTPSFTSSEARVNDFHAGGSGLWCSSSWVGRGVLITHAEHATLAGVREGRWGRVEPMDS